MDPNTRVNLDVGNVLYSTTRATLERERSTVFASLLEQLGEDNPVVPFIDRDGGLFNYILNYLRNGTIFITEPFLIDMLMCEATFYGLRQLEMQLLDLKEKTFAYSHNTDISTKA